MKPLPRKTQSLAYPSDPLAAIRELQNLDAVPNTVATNPESAVDHDPIVGPQSVESASVAALPVAPTTGSAVALATSSAASSVEPKARKVASSPGESKRSPDESQGTGDPMAEALNEMLAKPYTADAKKGPFTVSTVKIPTEVWERLGWLSAVSERPKQEIIADALKTHFRQVLKVR